MISKEYTFKLSDTQYKKLEKWFYRIYPKGTYNGAIGGALTFEITPTSIGDFITVRADGKELDLSEV